MDRTLDYYLTGRSEGILIFLQKLGKKSGLFPDELVTRQFVIEKLTELGLTEDIEPIIQVYFTNKP